ncbi:MAG: putative sulfate exporter family transporter [Woeseiaceae bacterium]|nr:putative sulfate exporter family transporter [Woeseiaceae bacterium]
MIAVIPLVGVLYASEGRASEAGRVSLLSMVPWFIIGFALMSAMRTIGDFGDRPFGVLSPDAWAGTVEFLRGAAERCLLVAMAAVGLTSMFSGLRDIGWRPFLLGLLAAALIGVVSLTLIVLLGPPLHTWIGGFA